MEVTGELLLLHFSHTTSTLSFTILDQNLCNQNCVLEWEWWRQVRHKCCNLVCNFVLNSTFRDKWTLWLRQQHEISCEESVNRYQSNKYMVYHTLKCYFQIVLPLQGTAVWNSPHTDFHKSKSSVWHVIWTQTHSSKIPSKQKSAHGNKNRNKGMQGHLTSLP